MGVRTFVLYDEFGDLLPLLDDEQAGKLFRALFDYREGREPEFSDKTLSVVFGIIRKRLDDDAKKYAAICERNRLAGKKGGEARANNCKRELADARNAKRGQAFQADCDYESDFEKICNFCPSVDGREQENEQKREKLAADKSNFELIYKAYPRKEGKAGAFKAYRAYVGTGKKINGETYRLTNDQLWNAVNKFAAECKERGTETEFIPLASTFFNGRILDYLPKGGADHE